MIAEIKNTVSILKNQQTILYPTDTIWGIGCDATDKKAIAKIYQIKKRQESKSLIILVNSIEMLQTYVKEIPLKTLKIIQNVKKPTTFIYKNPIGLADNVIAQDNTIAVRIVRDKFCQKLLEKFKKPIVSTSANISGDNTPKSFSQINTSILKQVDYVVNLHHQKITTKSSSILKIEDDKIIVIRK